MRIKKILITLGIIVSIILINSSNSFAGDYTLNVAFDGNTINSTSENGEIGLNALNLLPGETDTSYININNVGEEEFTMYMTAEIVNDQNLFEILEMEIFNSKDEQIYKSTYKEFEKVEIKLAKGESETYRICTTLPVEAGNEYQDKELNIKFNFEINGKEVINSEPVIPNYPQTNQSQIIIYAVLGGIIIFVIILLILINRKNKSNEVKNEKK